jgi:uridine kinase
MQPRSERARCRAPRSALIVGIAGGSGSGKTWLAEQLAASLAPDVLRLSMDDFYLDRSHLSPARRARINFDHPRAIDWEALEEAVRRLRAGRPACVPCYDFSTHCRHSSQRSLFPKSVVLVDGLWAWYRSSLRRMLDVRIFLTCPARTRLRRRLARDLKARGRTAESVRKQFRLTVEPMHRRFVEPQAQWADLILREGWGRWEAGVIVEVVRSLKEERAEIKSEIRNPKSERGRHVFGRIPELKGRERKEAEETC